MPLLDAFKTDAFSTLSLTDAFIKQPFVPGQCGALGIWQETGVSTTQVMLEYKDGWVSLVPTSPYGAPAVQKTRGGRTAVSIAVPHLAMEDTIVAAEVQDVRVFGSESQLEGIQAKINESQAEAAQSFDATLEWMRIGALKGSLVDADGSTTLLNLFTVFNVSQEGSQDWDLDAADPASGAVRKICHAQARTIQDKLGAATYTRLHAFCGANFMDNLVSHSECLTAYDRWNAGQMLREPYARRTFYYAGITFEEYRGTIGSVQFIGDDEVNVFPVGVPGLFRTYYAPADFAETVNTIGLPRYSKVAVDSEFNRWAKLHMQSNPLNICRRPDVVLPGTTSG